MDQPAPFDASWELRCGPNSRFRVFYDVDPASRAVSILASGIKDRNRLLIGEEEYENFPFQVIYQDGAVPEFVGLPSGSFDVGGMSGWIPFSKGSLTGDESWAGEWDKDGRLKAFRSAEVVTIREAGHWVHHDRLEHAVARDADLAALFSWWRTHPSE